MVKGGDKIRTHNIWRQGWLRNKPYCRNPKHEWFNPIIDNLVRDLNRGENRILLVVGTPRSGKSSFSLWLQCYMNWCYFGRSEYAPASENVEPLKDVYWKIDDFINATKYPENQDKFLTLEEQGAEQYKMDFLDKSAGLQAFDKLQQIFGVDNTNLIINLPYIFDIQKGTRLKAHYLLRAIKKGKHRVDIVLCKKRMNLVTDKANYVPTMTGWRQVPFIADIFPDMYKGYVALKLQYNKMKKEELINRPKKKGGGFWD